MLRTEGSELDSIFAQAHSCPQLCSAPRSLVEQRQRYRGDAPWAPRPTLPSRDGTCSTQNGTCALQTQRQSITSTTIARRNSITSSTTTPRIILHSLLPIYVNDALSPGAHLVNRLRPEGGGIHFDPRRMGCPAVHQSCPSPRGQYVLASIPEWLADARWQPGKWNQDESAPFRWLVAIPERCAFVDA